MLQNLQLSAQKQQLEGQISQLKDMRESDKHEVELIKDSAETLKLIRESMGVEAITGPEGVESFVRQLQIVLQQQNEMDRM